MKQFFLFLFLFYTYSARSIIAIDNSTLFEKLTDQGKFLFNVYTCKIINFKKTVKVNRQAHKMPDGNTLYSQNTETIYTVDLEILKTHWGIAPEQKIHYEAIIDDRIVCGGARMTFDKSN